VPLRGSIMGGAALTDPSLLDKPHRQTCIASTSVEWLEWNINDLNELMQEVHSIQGSFYSMLYGELLTGLQTEERKNQLERYQAVLVAVIADGFVDEKEKNLIRDFQKMLDIHRTSTCAACKTRAGRCRAGIEATWRASRTALRSRRGKHAGTSSRARRSSREPQRSSTACSRASGGRWRPIAAVEDCRARRCARARAAPIGLFEHHRHHDHHRLRHVFGDSGFLSGPCVDLRV
ncbi:unnamed protein product, partial [Prorocentrum cordatum]